MYGAVLRQQTELTESGEADIGVLFMTNEGYSTMCGHATIALGRFLVETHDLTVFPRRESLQLDAETQTVALRLHAPSGMVNVTSRYPWMESTRIQLVQSPSSQSLPSQPV
jgi:trans-L-3-hydroxyproline dehydratase